MMEMREKNIMDYYFYVGRDGTPLALLRRDPETTAEAAWQNGAWAETTTLGGHIVSGSTAIQKVDQSAAYRFAPEAVS